MILQSVALPVAALVLSGLLSFYLTPIMRTAALQFGIVDRPDGRLKHQAEPVPYLGGLAIYLAILVTLGITIDFSHEVLGILLAGTLMLLLGLIDDFGVLTPGQKLGGQFVAVIVLMKAGLYVELEFLPPPVAFALSALWLLTVTNALNILDVMDGLASGVAAIAALFLSAVGVLTGEPLIAMLPAAIAGSLLGFLRFNFAPARIYLGDSGSLFLGLTLAALAMNGSYTERNWVAMATPALLLGVPLFDLAFVSLIRIEKGLSPLRGSPDHFALRIRRSGRSVPRVTMLAYAAGITSGAAGLAIMRASSVAVAASLLAITAVVVLAIGLALRRLAP